MKLLIQHLSLHGSGALIHKWEGRMVWYSCDSPQLLFFTCSNWCHLSPIWASHKLLTMFSFTTPLSSITLISVFVLLFDLLNSHDYIYFYFEHFSCSKKLNPKCLTSTSEIQKLLVAHSYYSRLNCPEFLYQEI